MQAAIVIPHFNDQTRLTRCLDALLPQAEDRAEIVVVDNASPSRPDLPDGVRLVIETERGAAAARNRGVSETSAPLLLFIDSDCVPAEDWVEAALAAAPRADLIGGSVSVFDETAPPRSGAEAFETVFAFDFKSYIEKKGFAGSGNLVTSREVFEAVGGFRPGLSEDLDWCHRATAAGYRLIYDAGLRVAHPTRQDWPALRRKWRRVTEESWGLHRRDMWGRLLWAARAVAMGPSILAHAPRVLRHRALSGGEKARALATLVRLRSQRAAWMFAQAAGRSI